MGHRIARAIESAVLAKLREQEPVALVDERGVIIVCSYSYKPGDKLFTHPAPIPEGYALVPIEPTEAMITAGNDGFRSPDMRRHTVSGCYKAMLAAARSGE